MYSYISGRLDSIGDGYVVIDNHGIGYNVLTGTDVLSRLGGLSPGAEIKLYTYTNVKEDCFELYGFDSIESRTMFIKLIGVSGVGCKSAQQILSGMDPASLAIAIASDDIKALSRVKGIGKKTAERIIVELREKVDRISPGDNCLSTQASEDTADESVLALVALGINRADAVSAVNKARKTAKTTEEIITLALRSL